MLNEFIVQGRLGTKPKFYKEDSKDCLLSIATDANKKGPNGWEEGTRWVSIKAWDETAKRAVEKYEPGDILLVKGFFENKKVKDEYKTYVTARSVRRVAKGKGHQSEAPAKEKGPDLDTIPF